jgi:hypothetical protein
MTMHEPNPDVKPTGDEASEYVEDTTGGPPPPPSADPTGAARGDRADTGDD